MINGELKYRLIKYIVIKERGCKTPLFLLYCSMKIQKQIKEFFSDITFIEDGHRYVLGEKGLWSVSHIIHSFEKKVDWGMMAYYSGRKHGISAEVMSNIWAKENKISTDAGSRVHLFCENYVKGNEPTCYQELAATKFFKFLEENGYTILFKELVMYHKTYLFGGTADLILLDPLGRLIIADYKTNKDLFKNYKGQKLLGIFNDLLDQPYSKYEIQFSLYQILLEQVGIRVDKRWLVYLDRKGEYEIHETDDYTGRLEKYLIGKNYVK